MKKLIFEFLYKRSYSRAFFTLYGQVIQECKVSFQQFFTIGYPVRSFLRVIGAITFNLSRLIFGRSLKLSYSFTGEDRILEALIKKKIYNKGFYVDVGCNHPVFLSNTYLFYKRGWKGICIDANETLIKKYKLFRPRDVAVCALISDKPAARNFYFLSNNVLSTTETEFLQRYTDEGQNVTTVTMVSKTLTDVLDQLKAPTYFDILSVDAEEHDLQVLKSLDFNRYKPELIIVENEFSPDNPSIDEIYVYLTAQGFFLEGYILKNLYFRNKRR